MVVVAKGCLLWRGRCSANCSRAAECALLLHLPTQQLWVPTLPPADSEDHRMNGTVVPEVRWMVCFEDKPRKVTNNRI